VCVVRWTETALSGPYWQSVQGERSSDVVASLPVGPAISDAQQPGSAADTEAVTDLDNALGGSYNHPQHGSRLRASDQQLFTYIHDHCAHGITAPTTSDLALTRPGPTGSEATTSLLLSP
jgi:hypothetical protein